MWAFYQSIKPDIYQEKWLGREGGGEINLLFYWITTNGPYSPDIVLGSKCWYFCIVSRLVCELRSFPINLDYIDFGAFPPLQHRWNRLVKSSVSSCDSSVMGLEKTGDVTEVGGIYPSGKGNVWGCARQSNPSGVCWDDSLWTWRAPSERWEPSDNGQMLTAKWKRQ